jgi:hypothetical protein
MTSAGQEEVWRRCAPLVLAALVRRYGDFDAAEDAVQEALLAAARQWPTDGMPDNPRGWLITVASRRLADQWRAEQARTDREQLIARHTPPEAFLAPAADTLVGGGSGWWSPRWPAASGEASRQACRGSGAAAAGLVELAAVTLGGAARTRVAGAEPREGVAGRRRGAAVDQARSGQLGTDAGVEQPGHLDDPLAAPEPSTDRVADVDRRGRLGPHPVDLHVPGAAGLRGQGTCPHQPHRPKPAVDPGAVHASMVTWGAARCAANGLVGRPCGVG